MRSTLTNKIIGSSLLAAGLIILSQCKPASPEEKNKELIEKYNLTVREIPGLPKSTIESNLKPVTITSLDKLDSTQLYPGVTAKLFWGSGAMAGVLQLAPNAKIPEEILPANMFVFVMDGSVDETINGAPVSMISKKTGGPGWNTWRYAGNRFRIFTKRKQERRHCRGIGRKIAGGL